MEFLDLYELPFVVSQNTSEGDDWVEEEGEARSLILVRLGSFY